MNRIDMEIRIADRFESMASKALCLQLEYVDLPPLTCLECEKITSFGGKNSFVENIFVHNDICMCN